MNAAQVLDRELQEEVAKEKGSHVVDVQNITTHMAVDMERLEKEKEELPARIRVMESQFAKADGAVKVFGEKAVLKFIVGFCLAQAQILGKNPKVDLSWLNSLVKITTDPSWCDPKFLKTPASAPSSSKSSEPSP